MWQQFVGVEDATEKMPGILNPNNIMQEWNSRPIQYNIMCTGE